MGSHCYSSVIWAMEHGLKLHPTWPATHKAACLSSRASQRVRVQARYPGLTSKSTFAEFQEGAPVRGASLGFCSHGLSLVWAGTSAPRHAGRVPGALHGESRLP